MQNSKNTFNSFNLLMVTYRLNLNKFLWMNSKTELKHMGEQHLKTCIFIDFANDNITIIEVIFQIIIKMAEVVTCHEKLVQ